MDFNNLGRVEEEAICFHGSNTYKWLSLYAAQYEGRCHVMSQVGSVCWPSTQVRKEALPVRWEAERAR